MTPFIDAEKPLVYKTERKGGIFGIASRAVGSFGLYGKLVLVAASLFLLYLLVDSPVVVVNPNKGLHSLSSASFGLLQTGACSASQVSPGRPPIQYAVMIDAGSTGSRVHIYRFNFCNGSSPTLEDEIFEQVTPGLSSYAGAPENAAKSLDGLLGRAKRAVPEKLWSCTPIAVKATAGLRLLHDNQGADILAAVEEHLKSTTKFHLIDDGVVIMDGRDEGVYAWITVNYLLGNLGTKDRHNTAAIMDLGGGSTQIVFEPASKEIAPGDHRYALKFGNFNYTLYQHSYLGYGLMEGRKRLKSVHLTPSVLETEEIEVVQHPCLPVGYKEDSTSSQLVGNADSFESCYGYLNKTDSLFKSGGACLVPPCSFDGVYQPSLTDSFAEPRDIFAFSYFYDRMNALALANLPSGLLKVSDDPFKERQLPIEHFKSLAQEVCPYAYSHSVMQENPHMCLDLVFMYGLVARGYGLDDARNLRVAKKIKGFETGWCLGAAMVMVETDLLHASSLQCTA